MHERSAKVGIGRVMYTEGERERHAHAYTHRHRLNSENRVVGVCVCAIAELATDCETGRRCRRCCYARAAYRTADSRFGRSPDEMPLRLAECRLFLHWHLRITTTSTLALDFLFESSLLSLSFSFISFIVWRKKKNKSNVYVGVNQEMGSETAKLFVGEFTKNNEKNICHSEIENSWDFCCCCFADLTRAR